MQVKYVINSSAKSSSMVRKLVALLVSVIVIGLVLMFSVVVFAIIIVLGMIGWAYLWWKTRDLRKQMRDFPSRDAQQEEKMSDGNVFEGVAIRVVDAQDVDKR